MHTYANTVAGLPVLSAQSFESRNPATGELLGRVPHSSAEQVAQAVAAAQAAQPAWAALPDAERQATLLRVADILAARREELARWITLEQGKPMGGIGPDQVPGARFEAYACELWTRVPAGLSLPVEVVFEDEGRRDELHHEPCGVVAAIAPWNWPLMIAIWQIIPALRAGNTVVIKPSEHTSIGTLELVRLINTALPPGVLNSVSGPGEVGAALTSQPAVRKVLFTGSTATGRRIAGAAAARLSACTLELGGNDAAIVLPDADPRAIAQGVFWGAFLNMGQTCACIKRLYVHESLHDALVAELQALARALPMGDGLQEGIAMGPIQNRMQYDKVLDLVASARADGARIVCGGEAPAGPGYFYPITLVTDIADGTRLVDEEQFGPVLPILRYREVDDAVARANRLDVGLGASVWGRDLVQARAVALRLQAGTVWINQHGAVHPMVPFGGLKGSGLGVEFGLEGLKSVTRPRVISLKK